MPNATVLRNATIFCLGIILAGGLAVAQTANTPITFASGPTWQVYNADPGSAGATSLGTAQQVCLNFSTPKSCPNGAILYGSPSGGGWSADISSIPGASWIWAPNVTGHTGKADLKFYYFSKELEVPGTPVTGTISVAVDDYTKVWVNGQFVGEYGSITDVQVALAAQSALHTFDITSYLHQGTNRITVLAQNGPNTFNGCSQCRYSQNSAGVVFGGSITYGESTLPKGDELGFTAAWAGFDNQELRPAEGWAGFDNQELRPSPRSTAAPKTLVNSLNGNLIVKYRDLIYPGQGLEFNFIRYYNSLDPYSGPLGPGWTHAYNVHLRLGTSIIVKEADGREVTYGPIGDGVYAPVTKGLYEILEKNLDGSFVLTRKNHNKLYFSASGKLTSIADQNGRVLTCSYNSAGNLAQITDPAGRVFTLAYDQNNHLISLADSAGGRNLSYGYNGDGQLVSFIDPLFGETLYTYGPTGQLTVATQPDHSAGFVSISQLAGGINSFTNQYDELGRVISQQNPAGYETTVDSYNAPWPDPPDSVATTMVDPLGRETIHVYDNRSRLIQIIDALGGVTRYTYDDNNNRTSVTDPLGRITTFTYDSRGNVLSVTDANGAISHFTYDAAGDLLTATNGLGTTVAYEYDTRSNRISETDALGDKTAFTYDLVGHLVKVIDANRHATSYEYDAAGNLTAVTDANGNVTHYAYDAVGNRTTVTNAKGNTTRYTYDSLDRLITIADPLNNTTIYSYDSLGNLTSVRDANLNLTEYVYTPLNRVASASNGDGIVRYSYDAVGNRLEMADSRGTTLYTYDGLNRLTKVVQPDGKAVLYVYDAVGNRTSVQYPDLKKVSYLYDATNRMTSVADWSGGITRYTYNAAGNVTSVSNPNSTASLFQFDTADRLIGISNSFQGSDQDSIPLTSYRYVLDPVGNRTQLSDGTGQSLSYAYDALDQLVKVGSGRDSVSYTYDQVGNRTAVQSKRGTVAYTYDAADHMTGAGGATFTYDANGNRLGRTADGVATYYEYDRANRLASVTAGQFSSAFEYDGDGNRVAQDISGVGRYEYVNDIARRLTMVLQENGPDGPISYVRGRSLISESGTGFDYYYLYDALRSAVGLTDTAGRRAQRYVYDAWGAIVTSIPSPGVGTKNKFLFTGEALDPGTGLYYLRARYYDPETGRFLTKDVSSGSVLIPLSLNPYIYVRNNPLKWVDPSGRDWEPPADVPFDFGQWPFAPPWP